MSIKRLSYSHKGVNAEVFTSTVHKNHFIRDCKLYHAKGVLALLYLNSYIMFSLSSLKPVICE